LSQKIGNGYFIFDNDVAIDSEPELQEVSNYFALYLKENYNFKFSNNNSPKKISFKIDDFVKNEEGYELKVEKNNITIPGYGIIPEGKQGVGHKSWTFIDELIIE
jgi:hexosaminidase